MGTWSAVSLMRQAFHTGRVGDLAEFLETRRLGAWSSAKLIECYSEVDEKDEDRKSIAQLILQKSTALPTPIIVPVEGQGGVHTVVRVPSLPQYPLEDCICWVSTGH